MMDEDAADVADMRRLLTTIIGFSEWLADPKHELNEARRLEYAEIVQASGLELNARLERRHGLVTIAIRFEE